jgi:hypothetical protein
MDVVRPAVYGIQAPASVSARLSDLSLNRVTLLQAQATRIFGHSRLRFNLAQRVRKLPSMTVLHPTPGIARQPRAVGDPRQKVADRIIHNDLPR